MRTAIDYLSKKFSFTKSWSFQNRIIFFSTLVILLLIPITVVASITYRSLTTKAAGSRTYGDCTGYACTGPSLDTNWSGSTATFRIRYKCCYSPNFTNYVNVGSARSYTSPYMIWNYEVQIYLGSSWYPWRTSNNNGTSPTVSWAAPLYRSQLAHNNDFYNGSPINACSKGIGVVGTQLNGCVDHNVGTATAVRFTGLSPSEYYDLYVFVQDTENSGTTRTHVIQASLGPTGPCINCPVIPTPPSKPVANPYIGTLPTCLKPGSTWGNQTNFTWTGSGATTYAVDISDNSTFSTGFTNKIMNGTTFNASGSGGWNNQYLSTLAVNNTLVLQPGKTYYWRVYARNSSGYVYSNTQSQTVPICPTSLPVVPTNLNPGLTTWYCVPNGTNWGPTTTFYWNGSGATRYAVDVADNSAFSNFTNRVMDASGVNQQYNMGGSGVWNNNLGSTLAVGGVLTLQAGKTYYWRVYAENLAGHLVSPTSTISRAVCASKAPSKANITGDSDLLSCSKYPTWGVTHAFSWNGGSGATQFWVDVSDSQSFATFANKQLSGTTFSTIGSGGWNLNGSSFVLNGNLNLVTGKSYYFRVFSWNNYGGVESNISSAFTMPACPPDTQPSPQNTSLPSPWTYRQFGGSTLGGAQFNNNGVYNISGGGNDIWGSRDSFGFASMELNGNGTYAATVSNQTNTDGWAKAGIMMRASTSVDSPYAFISVTPSNGVAFQFRTTYSGNAQHLYSSAIDGNRRPMRLSIIRSGNTFTGYAYKTDGSAVNIGQATIVMPTRILFGFAVTSHNANAVSSAVFSNISGNAFADSRPKTEPTNLRILANSCSADQSSATVTFKWDGPTELGAYYILDISTNQNPFDRWVSGNYINNTRSFNVYNGTTYLPYDNFPRNATVFTWPNLQSNAVHYWRVYNANTGNRVYATAFVPCNTKPTGAPVSGYISSYFGISHPLGIDIARGSLFPVSQPVYATLGGTVVRAGFDTTGGYGNVVEIERPSVIINGIKQSAFVRYGHFASIDPSITVGKIIPWGTYLGIWGQTGTVDAQGGSDAIHVHYETRIGPENAASSTFTSNNYLQDPLHFDIDLFTCPLGQCSFSPF